MTAEKLTDAEIDNPDALSKFYRLLLSIARVIVSVVLSRGPHNEQTVSQARSFLTENRTPIVGFFKRQAKIGSSLPTNAIADVDELVELFVLLFAKTGFLEVRSYVNQGNLPKAHEWSNSSKNNEIYDSSDSHEMFSVSHPR